MRFLVLIMAVANSILSVDAIDQAHSWAKALPAYPVSRRMLLLHFDSSSVLRSPNLPQVNEFPLSHLTQSIKSKSYTVPSG